MVVVVVPLVCEPSQGQLVTRRAALSVAARLAGWWGRGPGVGVSALFLGHVGLGAVHRLDVLPQRAGVRVALGAAGDLAHVRFLWISRDQVFETFKVYNIFTNH